MGSGWGEFGVWGEWLNGGSEFVLKWTRDGADQGKAKGLAFSSEMSSEVGGDFTMLASCIESLIFLY